MKLYVGSLPYQFNDNELAELFSQVGQVDSARIIIDRTTGQSKGFGFVEMNNDQQAQAAMQQLNGTTVGTRTIVVTEAREPQNRGGGYGQQRRGGSGGGYRGGRY